MSNKIGVETLFRKKDLDYMEIDVRRALKNVGYVLVEMPAFNMEHLNATRDGKEGQWKPILSQGKALNTFYNARDYKKRYQKKVVLSQTHIIPQYNAWRERYNFGKLQIYKVALLRSLPGCGRQYYHCDTHDLDFFEDKPFDDYYLGAVCAPWKAATLHIK